LDIIWQAKWFLNGYYLDIDLTIIWWINAYWEMMF